MTRKNLETSGLEAILGIVSKESGNKSDAVKQRPAEPAAKPAGEGSAASPEHRRGRPKGSGKSPVERRPVSCKIREDQYLKLGAIAEMAGCSRQDLMDEAYDRLIASFEMENGPVDAESLKRYGKFNVKF